MEERKHVCEKNWYKDASIQFEKINREAWGWVLLQSQFATKYELADGYEGEIGDAMCTHILLISHCPFCGEALTEIEKNTW